MKLHVKRYEELSLDELYEILRLRESVFVVEQNCPCQDIDGIDRGAYHVFLTEGSEIQAYLRVLDKGVSFEETALGRVIAAKKGCGLGAKILAAGIRTAQEKFHAKIIKIEAQSYAKGFYEKQGFRQVSEEFMDDGIPHILMTLDCPGT